MRTAFGLCALLLAVAPGCGAGSRSSPPPAANADGGARSPRTAIAASLLVRTDVPGRAIDAHVLGANMAMWYDVTQPGIAPSLQAAGMTAVRWPGGSSSDQYHWRTHTLCNGGYADPNATFDNFMTNVAVPARLSVAMTLNYGSNAACSAGGDPTEAAAWVDYANNVKHYGVQTWTVGNEDYGSWEYDLHAAPHDAATYAQAVATGYYPQIQAKDAAAAVGVVVNPGWSPAWDPIVLSRASYDFVELHWYAQTPGQESDAYLLTQAPQALSASIAALRSELATAGRPDVPIHLGELGSVYANPGKQATSITQALFAGVALGELLTAGIPRATWWLGYGGCNDASGGNFSAQLYGWQPFGGYMMFSDGTPEYGCANAPAVARGTLLPTARAYQLMAGVVQTGAHVLATQFGGTATSLRAYAMTRGPGTGIVLFNLDQSTQATVDVTVAGVTAKMTAAVLTYGKAEYDRSQNNEWAGPVVRRIAAPNGRFTITLPPWSMNAVTVTPLPVGRTIRPVPYLIPRRPL